MFEDVKGASVDSRAFGFGESCSPPSQLSPFVGWRFAVRQPGDESVGRPRGGYFAAL